VGRPAVPVGKHWTFTLVSASQRFLCDAATPRESWEDALARLLRSVPEPHNPIEDLLLRSILARLVVIISRQHRRRNAGMLQMAEAVADILLNDSVTPQQAFARWAQRLASYPRTPKDLNLVSLIVRRSAFDTVNLTALAQEFGVRERAVRLAFTRAYGIPPRTYKRRTKVLCAIELLRNHTWDNETVAREAGFRSPKNLYGALRVDTGLTPRQIRRLSENDLQALLSRLTPHAQSAPAPVAGRTFSGRSRKLTTTPGSGGAAVARRKAG